MAGTLTLTGVASGLATGQKTVGPLTITGTATIGEIRDLALTTGDNAVTVPTGATAFYLVLPSGNSVQVKLRSNLNSADAGVWIGLTGWQAGTLGPGTTSLTLNAASAVSVELGFI